MESPNFYAIIPANIRYAKDLSEFQKLLYGEITALTDKTGYCRAGNKYFSELYDKKIDWISRVITDMWKKWYIEIVIDCSKWNVRKIYLWEMKKASGKVAQIPIVEKDNPIVEKHDTYCRKVQDPIVEKHKHNNTRLTNIKNNKKDSKKDFENKTFERFWELYPRKVWKKKTLESFLKISEENFSFIISWIEKYKTKWEKEKTELEFIPHPTTWLNQERRSDEILITDKRSLEERKRARLKELEKEWIELPKQVIY